MSHNDIQWARNAGLLLAWLAEHGEPPTKSVIVDGVKLGAWVKYQRLLRRKGLLAPERAALLEAMPGWTWEATAVFDPATARAVWLAAWDDRMDRIEAEVTATGWLPSRTSTDGEWLHGQRRADLTPDQEQRLAALRDSAPTDNPSDRRWRHMLGLVTEWVTLHGSALVPRDEMFRAERIGVWVNSQRTAYRRGRLPRWRIAELEAIPGWLWESPHGRAAQQARQAAARRREKSPAHQRGGRG